MIVLHPSAEQKAEAARDAKSMGCLPNSVTYGRGNLIGMLAEIVAADWLKATRVRPPVYSHDIEFNGRTIDVKAKRCSSVPMPEYTASVFAKNGKHGIKSDILLFTRVTDDYDTVYLLGWLTTRQFARRAEFVERGTREGGFIHRADGWHVPLSRLRSMEELAALSPHLHTAA